MDFLIIDKIMKNPAISSPSKVSEAFSITERQPEFVCTRTIVKEQELQSWVHI